MVVVPGSSPESNVLVTTWSEVSVMLKVNINGISCALGAVTTWSEVSVMLKVVIFPSESVEIVTSKGALPLDGIVFVSMKSETVAVIFALDRLSNAAPVNDVSNDIETVYGE
jgi:hypothetical protein